MTIPIKFPGKPISGSYAWGRLLRIVGNRPGDSGMKKLARELHMPLYSVNVLFFLVFVLTVSLGVATLVPFHNRFAQAGIIITKPNATWSGLFVLLLALSLSYVAVTGLLAWLIALSKDISNHLSSKPHA